MKSLAALITLGVFAIVLALAYADKLPRKQDQASPVAVAQALASIEELPLPQAAKDTYCTRIRKAPEAHLPFLVDEARKAVDFPMDRRACKILHGRPSESAALR